MASPCTGPWPCDCVEAGRRDAMYAAELLLERLPTDPAEVIREHLPPAQRLGDTRDHYRAILAAMRAEVEARATRKAG